VRGRASTDKRARGVSGRGGERTDRAGSAPGDLGTDRRARASGVRARSGISRSGPCDEDRTEGIKPGRGERLQAALLLSTVVRQAQARVAPGSPDLDREGENATTNSMAGKRPRIRGQRGENDGEKVSGGPE
jgi:hypothetical protein